MICFHKEKKYTQSQGLEWNQKNYFDLKNQF